MILSRADLVFGGVVAAIGILSIPSCLENQRQFKVLREKYSANQQVEQMSRIADKRYQDGCLPLVRGTHPNLTYASIVAGQRPVDRHTGDPYSPNTVVCDSNGATGIIDDNGKVSSVVVTQNRDVVAKRLKRFRGGLYSQPVVGK